MLKLFVEHTEADNPTMKVRWCTNAATLAGLKAKGIFTPSILLVVYNVESGREYRSIHNIGDLLAFVAFRNSGENRIFAKIVWDTDENTAYDRFLRTSEKRFVTSVLKRDGSGFLEDIEETADAATAKVHVDQRLFPERPFDWQYVNSQFRTPAVDQCQFRRRRMVAYTIIPLFLVTVTVFYLLVTGIVALGTLLVGRVPKWEMVNPITQPCWGGSLKDIFEYQPWYFKKWYSVAFRPIFPLAAIIIGLLFGRLLNATLLSTVLGWTAVVFITVATLAVTMYFIGEAYDKNSRNRRAEALRRKQQEQEEKERAEELKQLRERETEEKRALLALCSLVDDRDPMNIPKPAVTARLRFNGIKRGVCRPFAQ